MAQSAIGQGMGVYSRFAKVLEADGTAMNVRSALQILTSTLQNRTENLTATAAFALTSIHSMPLMI